MFLPKKRGTLGIPILSNSCYYDHFILLPMNRCKHVLLGTLGDVLAGEQCHQSPTRQPLPGSGIRVLSSWRAAVAPGMGFLAGLAVGAVGAGGKTCYLEAGEATVTCASARGRPWPWSSIGSASQALEMFLGGTLRICACVSLWAHPLCVPFWSRPQTLPADTCLVSAGDQCHCQPQCEGLQALLQSSFTGDLRVGWPQVPQHRPCDVVTTQQPGRGQDRQAWSGDP